MTPEELKAQFKDTGGRWRTANLFEETCEDPAKYPPIFTLKDSDTASCVSLKERYLECRDLTEYQFANIYLGGWDHWCKITESWILKPHIESWRTELRLKLRMEALEKIVQLSQGDGPSALNAAVKLISEIEGARAPKRGRPSKTEKEGYLKNEARAASAIAADADRLGLKVVK